VSELRCRRNGVLPDLETTRYRSVDLEPGRPVSAWGEFHIVTSNTHRSDSEAAAWVAEVRDLIEQFEQGTPQFRLDLWRALFETQSFKSFFRPPKERSWSYPVMGSLDIVTDRAMSKSYIAVQADDIKATIKVNIKRIVDRGSGRQWIDEDNGYFEYPYKTLVVVFQRK
jgi:hypothetical protein